METHDGMDIDDIPILNSCNNSRALSLIDESGQGVFSLSQTQPSYYQQFVHCEQVYEQSSTMEKKFQISLDEIKFTANKLDEEKQFLAEENKRILTENTSLNNSLKERYKEIDDLNKKINNLQQNIQTKDDHIKELSDNHLAFKEVLKEKNKEIQNVKSENHNLKQERVRKVQANRTIKELRKSIESLENQLEDKNNEIRQLNVKHKRKLQEEIQKLNTAFDEEVRQLNATFDNRLDKVLEEKKKEVVAYKVEILALDKQIKQLKEHNDALKDENSTLQNYIGKATTLSLSDDNENHSVQLVKDFDNIQTMIMDYVGNLRPNVEVNFTEVNKLLRQYGSKSYVSSLKKGGILIVKAVLRRHVFEEIIRLATSYFLKSQSVNSLEHKICQETEYLLDSLYKFSTTRDGTNDITKTWPIKIRQQIYAFLGNLGFADIIENETKYDHPFMVSIRQQLNRSINYLRIIKDPKRKNLHNDMAADLIREVIRIYFFRLKIQEPIAVCHWFKYNDKIDPNLMKGRWDNEHDENDENDEEINDENNNNLLVDLCYFPLLVTNFGKNDQKIYTHAHVVHQFKSSQGLVNSFKKAFGM